MTTEAEIGLMKPPDQKFRGSHPKLEEARKAPFLESQREHTLLASVFLAFYAMRE